MNFMNYEGILPLYKPAGMTSHDCVFKLRKILKMRKIGHTGTLDPEVDGVLPLCLGRATRVAEYLTDADKVYEGEITLGVSTTTEDQTGEIVATKPITEQITKQQIEKVLNKLTGLIEQTPPLYSAVKVKGKRLYEYARAGLEVERPTREVNIYSFELKSPEKFYTGETIKFSFKVSCSKGTYVRTLAVMVGEMLGYPAHMSMLTRTSAGIINLSDCLTFSEVEAAVINSSFSKKLLPLEVALSHLPNYIINDKVTEKVKNGAVLPVPKQFENCHEPIVLKTECGVAIAIYMKHPRNSTLIKPHKVLRNDFTFENR